MVKKYLCLLLVFTVCFALYACKGEQNEVYDNAPVSGQSKNDTTDSKENLEEGIPVEELFSWKNVDGGVEITEYKGSSAKIIIPDIVDNKKVVSIGNTFEGNVVVESMVISKYVTAFDLTECDNLKQVEWGVEEIAYDEFTDRAYPIFPAGIEALYLPNNTNFSFGYIEEYGENLKILDLSSCPELVVCHYGSLEEVYISSDIRYGFHYGNPSKELTFGGLSADETKVGLYAVSVDWEFQWVELTDDNRAEYYAKTFGEGCTVHVQ